MTLFYPLDTARLRLQVDEKIKSGSTRTVLAKIIKEEGVAPDEVPSEQSCRRDVGNAGHVHSKIPQRGEATSDRITAGGDPGELSIGKARGNAAY
ncbi:hypothetical protein chiPu_0021740 [Chiloscyllium punctatum]|uniref:Uncharacterized protein n=1 Tax=Chiloscyllium punctatum TaxID=137246 RepID=A0A401RL98_CHIPU|nr:hypothetical protein [Chiloscyllium punctatum]